jgi:hypothetical protein
MRELQCIQIVGGRIVTDESIRNAKAQKYIEEVAHRRYLEVKSKLFEVTCMIIGVTALICCSIALI